MELSPSTLETNDLAEALRLHCDLFRRRQQIECQLELDYRGGLQPEQDMAVYRIVQESLANTQQHAAATRVTVSLREEAAQVILTVSDNGKGFDPQAWTKRNRPRSDQHGYTSAPKRRRVAYRVRSR